MSEKSKCTECKSEDDYNFSLNVGLCNACIGKKLEQLAALKEQTRWIPVGERLPEVDEMALAVVQHWHTKGLKVATLFKVDESDCEWRTVDDNSELSHAWNVTHWRPIALPKGAPE